MFWSSTKRTMECLVEAHYRSLYAFGYRLTGSANEAEDLVQETFCQAQSKWHQVRDSQKAKSWLFTILRNLFLHRRRHEKTEARVPVEDWCEIPQPTIDPQFDIDPQQLQETLQKLPEEFRTPIILFYFEDFSYKEIAEQMELPLGTVMSRLARAKAFLRHHLLSPAWTQERESV